MQALERLSKQEPTAREEITKRLLREHYQGSLYHTAKYLLGYSDINWRTHGRAIEALENLGAHALIVLPRGSFKSSLACEAYPIWRLLSDPNRRFLIDSEVYTNSKNFLRKIRALLEMDNVVSLFGQFKNPDNWNEGEITIAQRTKPFKEASITCSGIGAVKVGQHYDEILFDDMNSMNNSQTPEGCQKVIDHYKMAIGLLEPGGRKIVTATRYSALDLPAFILDNEVNPKGLLAG